MYLTLQTEGRLDPVACCQLSAVAHSSAVRRWDVSWLHFWHVTSCFVLSFWGWCISAGFFFFDFAFCNISVWWTVSLQKLPAKWIGISGLIMFALGSGVGYYGFPALIRSQIASVSLDFNKIRICSYCVDKCKCLFGQCFIKLTTNNGHFI